MPGREQPTESDESASADDGVQAIKLETEPQDSHHSQTPSVMSESASAQPPASQGAETIYRLAVARYLLTSDGRAALEEISRLSVRTATADDLAARLRIFLGGAENRRATGEAQADELKEAR
jgi:hypothetical protein